MTFGIVCLMLAIGGAHPISASMDGTQVTTAWKVDEVSKTQDEATDQPTLDARAIPCAWGTMWVGPEFEDQAEELDQFIATHLQRIRQAPDLIEQYRTRCDEAVDAINEALGVVPDDDLREMQQAFYLDSLDVGYATLPPAAELEVYVVETQKANDYVRAGGNLPLLRYDEQRDIVHGTTYWQVSGSTHIGILTEQPFFLPGITLRVESEQDVFDQIAARLTQIYPETTLGVACHEAIELTLLRDSNRWLPRWFSDGVANALAIHLMNENGYRNAATICRDLFLNPDLIFAERELNLRYWPAADLYCAAEILSEKDLSVDRYSVSGHIAAEFLEAEGVEGLQKILDAIRAGEPPDSRVLSSERLCHIIEQHTGYVIGEQLDQYQNFTTIDEAKRIYGPAFLEAREANDRHGMLFNHYRLIEIGLIEDPSFALNQLSRFATLLEESDETQPAVMALNILAQNLQDEEDKFNICLRAVRISGEAGRLELAYPFVDWMLESSPASPTGRLTKADQLYSESRYEEARAILDPLIEVYVEDDRSPDWVLASITRLDEALKATAESLPVPNP